MMMYRMSIPIGTTMTKKNKILAVMGSPRRGKNTEEMLHIFVEEHFVHEDVEVLFLQDMDYSPCVSCYGCARVSKCVLIDDLTPIYEKIDGADILLLASPIYFNSVSAQLKSMIDRMQVYWSRKYILQEAIPPTKIGYALLDGGAPAHEGQFTGAKLVLDHFFAAVGCKTYYRYEISDTDRNPITTENVKIREILAGPGIEKEQKG